MSNYFKAKDIIKAKRCTEDYRLSKLLISQNNRAILLHTAINKMAKLLCKGSPYEEIYREVKKTLVYEHSWFEYEWQHNALLSSDLYLFKRFLEWFFNYQIKNIREVSEQVHSLEKEIYIDNLCISSLTATPHALVDISGKTYAMFIEFHNQKTPRGRSLETNLMFSLEYLVTVNNFKKYNQDIGILSISLKCNRDTNNDFCCFSAEGKTGESNVFILDYSSENTSKMLNDVVNYEFNKNCFNCSYSNVCQTRYFDEEYQELSSKVELTENIKPSSYILPEFNIWQKEAIETTGNCLICAGPGSGKTATLVGKVKHMVDNGTNPGNILLLSFTNKAVEEISERLSCIIKDYQFLTISTINSICFQILKDNKSKINSRLKLLDDTKAKIIIYRLLQNMSKPLQGFSYGKIQGKNSLIDTLYKKINEFINEYDGDKNRFISNNNDIANDFIEFAEEYLSIINRGGYISFNQQIILCNKLLKENPDIRKIYQIIYKYIFVDEFQDISKEQHEFITLISSGNTCIVGDDDQAIFGFNGGDSKYMLSFKKDFSDAKTVILKDNYRCSNEIMSYAQNLISLNSSHIVKNIATHFSGPIPAIYNNQTTDLINALLAELSLSYQLKDIAILSTTNLELKNLKPKLNVSSYITKNQLIKDPLCTVIYNLMKIYFNGMDDLSLYLIINGFNKDYASSLRGEEYTALYNQLLIENHGNVITNYNYYHNLEPKTFCELVFKFISYFINYIEICIKNELPASSFVKHVANELGINESYALDHLISICDSKPNMKLRSFYEDINFRYLFEDDTMLQVNNDIDAVKLMTIHESKGKEFKVVIMIGCEKIISLKEDAFNESLCKAYVGMTRAKEQLFMMAEANKTCKLFDLLNTFINHGKECEI